jgi:hypothetical protein
MPLPQISPCGTVLAIRQVHSMDGRVADSSQGRMGPALGQSGQACSDVGRSRRERA